MHLFLEGFLGDRGLLHTGDTFTCPYGQCPSNLPFDGAHKPKMKFIQKISPRVYQYRCKYCGCLLNKGFDGPAVPEAMWGFNLNPKLISNKPSYDFRRW